MLRVAHVLRSTEAHPDVVLEIGGWATLPQQTFGPWLRFVEKRDCVSKNVKV